MKRFRSGLLLLLSAGLTFSACVKQPNDAPPDTSNYDPNLPVNITIRELKAMNGPYSPNGSGDDTMRIDSNLTAAAIVIANDKSGNFYKQIVVQDSTGGIAINIDDYRLYANYPVGRKIYIKLKGMMLSYNGGTPVLGMGVDDRKASQGLAGSKIDEHIVKANVGYAAKDTVVDFDAVRNFTLGADEQLLNRLITIKGVQFADTGKMYTEPTATTNRNIQTCAGSTAAMVVRTSNYADFHTYQLPRGNGDITGIYTVFVNVSGTNKTPQLLIRDTMDVKFGGPRCENNTPPPTPGVVLLAEDFNGATSGDIALAGWANIAQFGTQKWKYSNSGSTNNPYARISAFGSNETNVVSWLVTPSVNLSGAVNPRLSFKSARGFDNGATLQLMATNNFTGDVNTTVWTPLTFATPTSNATGFGPFLASGDISLAVFGSGNVWIAWKYVGSDQPGTTDDKTTTWEVDDVKISKN